MMRLGWTTIVFGVGFLIGLNAVAAFEGAKGVPRMTAGELNARLEDPNLLILDVRIGLDWTDSDSMIKGAERKDPREFQDWIDQLPSNKTIVLYCT